MTDWLTDLRFWAQIEGDSKRTIACSTTEAPRIREAIEAAGWDHIITVLSSPIVTDGQVIVMDVQAMDAYFREASQRPIILPPW